MKDPATVIGVGLGLVVIVTANVLEGGNPMSLLLLPPMLLVFGTTLLITIAGGTIADFKQAIRAMVKAFKGDGAAPGGDLEAAHRDVELRAASRSTSCPCAGRRRARSGARQRSSGRRFGRSHPTRRLPAA